MSTGQYVCQAPGRVDALRDAARSSPPRLINGIQYLEVAPGQHDAGAQLAQVARLHALHRGLGADRHEARRLDLAVRRREARDPGTPVARIDAEGEAVAVRHRGAGEGAGAGAIVNLRVHSTHAAADAGPVVTLRVHVASIASPPSTAKRSCNVPDVSVAKIGVRTTRNMSPVSSPAFICMMVMPVSLSPANSAR